MSRALISWNEIAAGLLLQPVRQCVNSVLREELWEVSGEYTWCHMNVLGHVPQAHRPGPQHQNCPLWTLLARAQDHPLAPCHPFPTLRQGQESDWLQDLDCRPFVTRPLWNEQFPWGLYQVLVQAGERAQRTVGTGLALPKEDGWSCASQRNPRQV